MKAIILMCAFLFSQQKPFDGTGTATTNVGSFTITNPPPMAEQRKTWLAARLKEVKEGATPYKICEMDNCDEHYAVPQLVNGNYMA